MNIPDIASLVHRAEEVTTSLRLPKDERFAQIRRFLSGPVVLAVAGSRSLGREELANGLLTALPSASIRTDVPDEDLEHVLADAVILATPADAALSAKELDLIRAARLLKRPVLTVVTDAEKLGRERGNSQREIEAHRLSPLLEPEGVQWCFRGKGEPSDPEVALVKSMLKAEPAQLHGKPSADLLARSLEGAEAAFLERCQIRERDFALLHHAEAQGALDLAQMSEVEKLERLRAGNRILNTFEKVLVAAEGTGEALLAWARAGALGDGKDATSALEEAWEHFSREMLAAPRDIFSRIDGERRRLEARVRETAAVLGVELQVESPQKLSAVNLPENLSDAAQRIANTSIQDLIDSAIDLASAASSRGDKKNDKPSLIPSLTPRGNPAEQINGHLVQGIRSRVDIRLKTFLEQLEEFFKGQAPGRLNEWENSRNEIVARMRATLDVRYAWSAALGELQLLRQEIEEYRRTHP